MALTSRIGLGYSFILDSSKWGLAANSDQTNRQKRDVLVGEKELRKSLENVQLCGQSIQPVHCKVSEILF